MISTVLLLAALTITPEQVRDADDRMVAECELLEDVTGKSGWGGGFGTTMGIKGAKKSARKKAAKRGGTHIVWGQITNGMLTTIQARVYRCSSTPD